MTVSETEGEPAKPADDQVAIPAGQMPLPGFMPPLGPATAQVQVSTYQGPIPPPQILGAYEQVHTGAAAWILREAETSAAHVREMERQALKYQARDALLHRILPFSLVAILLLVSAVMAIFANVILGGIAFVTTLAGVVTVYLKGSMGAKQ